MADVTPVADGIGWYKLPRSGVPYYGPIPDGAETITENAVAAAVVDSSTPINPDPAFVLHGTTAEVSAAAEGYSIDEVRRLIDAEQQGRNRSSLLERLERIAKAKEEIPASG